jgi:hypothetical protein
VPCTSPFFVPVERDLEDRKVDTAHCIETLAHCLETMRQRSTQSASGTSAGSLCGDNRPLSGDNAPAEHAICQCAQTMSQRLLRWAIVWRQCASGAWNLPAWADNEPASPPLSHCLETIVHCLETIGQRRKQSASVISAEPLSGDAGPLSGDNRLKDASLTRQFRHERRQRVL